jgi:serine/threonine protein kinase/WD40 repeat protein
MMDPAAPNGGEGMPPAQPGQGNARRADPEAFERARAIFVEVCDLGEDDLRAALERACGDDVELRRAVQSLLEMDRSDDDLFSEAAVSQGLAFGLAEHRTDVELPAEIGGYRILRKLGEGGMGTVYEAEQRDPKRIVAVKTLQRWHASPSMIRRFRQESQLLGRLQHPGIAHIYEASIHDARDGSPPLPYFAMELVEGLPLHRHLEEHKLSSRDRLALFLRIADAVAYAHQRGVVHRDLKPGNILVDNEGQPKVIDFGIATNTDPNASTATLQTHTGQLVGTVPYMSPEQFGGKREDIDVRSDVYSLGVVLYEVLSGRLPHDVRSLSLPDAARVIRDDSHPRLGSICRECRGDLETIVNKALEKEADRRYGSVSEFAADIRRYLDHQPITARPPSTYDQLSKFARRNKSLVGGLVGVFVVLVAGIISTTAFWWEARSNFRTQRWATYRATIEAASMALEQDDVDGARDQLALSPPELRGWEWQFLSRGLDQWESVVECGDSLIGGVSFLDDGRSVVGVTGAGRVCVWDIERGTLNRACDVGAEIAVVADCEAGGVLAVATSTNEIVLVDLESGVIRDRIPWTAPPRCLAVEAGAARDIRSIIIGTDDHLSVLEPTTKAIRWERKIANASRGGKRFARVSVTQTSEGGYVLASVVRALTRVEHVAWHLATGDERGRLRTDDGRSPAALAPDGRSLAVAAVKRDILLADITISDIRARPTGDREGTRQVRFSPDGSLVASIARDGIIRVRSVEDGRSLAALQQPAPPNSVDGLAFDRVGRRLATNDGTRIYVWRIGSELAPQLRGHRGFAYSATFAQDSRTIASGSFNDLTTRLWDALTGESLAAFPGVKAASEITFPDENTIFVHGAVRLTIDAATGEVRSREKGEAGRGRRLALVLRPDGVTIEATFGYRKEAAAGEPTQVRLSERIGDDDRPLCTLDHDAAVRSVAFSPQARIVAVGCDDGTVALWDVANRSRIGTLAAHVGDVYSMAFSPDGTRLATGGNDGALRLWDCASWERVLDRRDHHSYVHSVRFSPDGTRIVTASGDGTLRLWDSVDKPQRLVERREAAATRDAAVRLVEAAAASQPITEVAALLRADTTIDQTTRTAALREIARRAGATKENRP